MRGGLFLLLPLLTACNPGVPQPAAPENKAQPVRRATSPPPQPPTNVVAPVNQAQPPAAEEPAVRDPGLASMSPYRRREYERGYRDCMIGNFDRERQGESYRIGCMAAEEARERRAR